MKTIFIVDDNYTNLTAAKNALDGAFKSYALSSAERMFKLAEKIVGVLETVVERQNQLIEKQDKTDAFYQE